MLKKFLRHVLANNPTLSTVIWRRKAAAAGLQLRKEGSFIELERGTKLLRIRASHGLYVPHMIESFDYYWNSVIPVEVGGKQLVDMSEPRYHRLIGFGDTPFLFPSHTEPYSTTQEYLDFADIKPGDVILDIGAYSGVTSIIFAGLTGPAGHVYAFEADKTNYACAKTNIDKAKEAGVGNISLFPKAVWSHCDGLLFSNEGSMGSSAVAITGGGRGEESTIESITIEQLCADNGLQRIDFAKIDIEGGETELLRSSARTLKSLGARLIVEPHRVGGVLNTEECRRILSDAGFTVRVRDKTPGSEALIEATA
jgi:FkbM family methyltransferase